MKLSRFGRLQMNNPARAWAQRRITARHMLRLGGDTGGADVLEIGCGRGVGVQILLEDFQADHVDAFDLDPKLVQMAQRRLALHESQTRLWVGDATAIERVGMAVGRNYVEPHNVITAAFIGDLIGVATRSAMSESPT